METPIVQRIIEGFTQFQSESNLERNQRYSEVINGFHINNLTDSGYQKKELDETLKKAEKVLASENIILKKPVYNSHIAIKKLGKEKRGNNEEAKQDNIRTAFHMARILAAYQEDITLTAGRHSAGVDDVRTEFILSSETEKEETICSMIRGVYGQVEAVPADKPKLYDYTAYANGKILYREKEQQKEKNEFEKIESWITAVLLAQTDRDFTVSIRFCPLAGQDRNSILERITEMCGIYDELKFYSELNWNNNLSLGNSKNDRNNFIAEKVQTVKRYTQKGENYLVGMSLSGNEVDKKALIMMEHMEYEIMRLKKALDTTAWGISIMVSAEDMDTLQSVSSLFMGTLEYSHLHLEWDKDIMDRISLMMNGQEILPLLMFPTKEYSDFSFVENDDFSLVSQSSFENGFPIGKLLWNGRDFAPFYLDSESFSRHAFICGMTGSGKTNTLFNLLCGVDLPFCVIEPVKGEYRALHNLYPDLKVRTMKVDGNQGELVSTMRINPFWFPSGSSIAYHIDSLKTIIASAFELSAAMPNILEQCLYNIYIKTGWDMVTNRNIYSSLLPEKYLYPTFGDLCTEIEDYLDKAEFGDEVLGNYKGAMLSRIRSFVSGFKGILMNTTEHPDYQYMMDKRCVIELEGLADDADKCLVMGTILIQYFEFLKKNFRQGGGKQNVQHIIVLEEAHRLFKNTQKQKANEGPDATGQLVDTLSNMMAEIRAFGEGILIVDQSPSKIAEDVIKNSAMKIVHRIDNGTDIKMMQSPMLMQDDVTGFASLKQGEALIRTDGMVKPCKLKMLLADVKEAYSLSDSFQCGDPADSELADEFMAGSVLNEDMVYLKMEELVRIYFNTIAIAGMEQWYEMTETLLCSVIAVLEKCKKYDGVTTLNYLFELILLTTKRMFRAESVREYGVIHLFAERILYFYGQHKDGVLTKQEEVKMFGRYFNDKVIPILHEQRSGNLNHYRYEEYCRLLKLDGETMFTAILSEYVDDVLPALKKVSEEQHIDADMLQDDFCIAEVFGQAVETISDIGLAPFEMLSQFLEKLKNE